MVQNLELHFCVFLGENLSDFWKTAFYMMIWRTEVLVKETGYMTIALIPHWDEMVWTVVMELA